MDLAAPADAWYVWVGVSLLTVGLAGTALSLPSQPPPDAQRAANAIDQVAASQLGGTATYDHDAEMVRFDPQAISLRNDAGTQHATISFGRLAPVGDNGDLEAVLSGGEPTDPYSGPDEWTAFHDDVTAAQDRTEDPTWRLADGTLRVRVVVYEHPDPTIDRTERAILVDA